RRRTEDEQEESHPPARRDHRGERGLVAQAGEMHDPEEEREEENHEAGERAQARVGPHRLADDRPELPQRPPPRPGRRRPRPVPVPPGLAGALAVAGGGGVSRPPAGPRPPPAPPPPPR